MRTYAVLSVVRDERGRRKSATLGVIEAASRRQAERRARALGAESVYPIPAPSVDGGRALAALRLWQNIPAGGVVTQ